MKMSKIINREEAAAFVLGLLAIIFYAAMVLLNIEATDENLIFRTAAVFWRILPILYLLFTLIALWKKGRESKLTALLSMHIKTALALHLGLVLAILFSSPLALPRLFIALIPSLTVCIMQAILVCAVSRRAARWISVLMLVIFTVVGMLRGVLHIVIGNIGGILSTIFNGLLNIVIPFDRLAYLSVDILNAQLIAVNEILKVLVFFTIFILALVLLKKFKRKSLRALIMVVTFFSLFLTANLHLHQLDYKTQAAIEDAKQLTSEKELWPGYHFGDVPIAVRSGDKEIYINQAGTKVREASIDVLAYTAIELDAGPELFVLNYPDSRPLLDPFATNTPEETLISYRSILLHEGFHAFQMLEYPELFEVDSNYSEMEFREIYESLIAQESYNTLWDSELQSMYDFLIGKTNISSIKVARAARKAYEEQNLNSDELKTLRQGLDKYQKIEGSAYYVEMLSLGNDIQKTYQFQTLSAGAEGDLRFYASGMANCLLRNQISPDWKLEYRFENAIEVE